MKKLITAVLIIGCSLFCFQPCFAAAEGNIYYGSKESEEINGDKDLILQFAGLHDLMPDEIEFNKIIRMYADSILPEKELKSPEEMRKYLTNTEYGYYIPAHKEEGIHEGDYYLQIEKGKGISVEEGKKVNLTDDQIEDLQNKKGKWHITAITVKEPEDTGWDIVDYWERMTIFLDCMGITESETFFLGGMSRLSTVIGVCYTEGLESPYYVTLDKIDLNAKTADDVKNCIFTYDEISESTWEKYFETAETGLDLGGTIVSAESSNAKYWIYAAVAVVIVGVVTVFVIIKRKKKIS